MVKFHYKIENITQNYKFLGESNGFGKFYGTEDLNKLIELFSKYQNNKEKLNQIKELIQIKNSNNKFFSIEEFIEILKMHEKILIEDKEKVIELKMNWIY